MNPDRISSALAALPRFDADDRRAARTRSRCHAAFARRTPPVDRVAPPSIALNVFPPLAVAGCVVFLAMLIGQAVRIVTLTP